MTIEIRIINAERKTASGPVLFVSGHMRCIIENNKLIQNKFQENILFYAAFGFVPNKELPNRTLLIDNEN